MRSIVFVISLVLVIHISPAHADDGRCAAATRWQDTVILLGQDGQFDICRHGRVQEDVVTGRPVYLELRPDTGPSVYEFRISERDRPPTASGLRQWHEQAAALTKALSAVVDSGRPIEEPVPRTAEAQRPIEVARLLYLGVVTPGLDQALRDLGTIDELPEMAAALRRWCARLPEGDAVPGLAQRCAAVATDEPRLASDVEAWRKARHEFNRLRVAARAALVIAEAVPDSKARQQEAVQALDDARAGADALVAAAERLRPTVRVLDHAATAARAALHSQGALRPGVPVLLARYNRGGNGVLHVDVRPVGILAAGVQEADADTRTLTMRFSIVDTHYFDVEAGLGVTGGLPQIPQLVTVNNVLTLQGAPVDEFVALALVELEPLRFAFPDKPWAGLLRLPVVAIPLSRNPTQNFFIGAGVGWTGIGSLTAGPYLLRERTLQPGVELGEPLPAGSSFSGATHPTVEVGYFVAASIDLVGLFHLFVPTRATAIDAATGGEL